MTAEAQRAAIREEFARQAAAFEDPRHSFGNPDVLAWVAEHSPTSPDDVVIEVAAGTGWVSRALAPFVRVAIATDVTPEMLAAGKRAVDAAAVRNVVFQEADAAALPFLDESFDRVACRPAVHHFDDPTVMLREMVRVCRPGGTVTVIDIVAPEAAGDTMNELERLRDPTRTRALTRAALHDAMTSASLRIDHTAHRENPLVLSRWLAQTHTPPDRVAVITAALEAELDGGPPTGFEPRRDGNDVALMHHWELVVGVR